MNYTTKVDFQAHVDIVHKGLPKLACDECGRSYTREAALRRHKNKVHLKVMPSLEDVQCDECNKILSNKQGLQRHKWRQHGEPQFESDICHEHFRDPDYLQDHHQVEHLKIPFVFYAIKITHRKGHF